MKSVMNIRKIEASEVGGFTAVPIREHSFSTGFYVATRDGKQNSVETVLAIHDGQHYLVDALGFQDEAAYKVAQAAFRGILMVQERRVDLKLWRLIANEMAKDRVIVVYPDDNTPEDPEELA
jgi:nucleoside-triphosphatase THEP1